MAADSLLALLPGKADPYIYYVNIFNKTLISKLRVHAG